MNNYYNYYPLTVFQCKQINLFKDHVYALFSTMEVVYFMITKTWKLLYLNFVLGNNLSCETWTRHIYFKFFFLVNVVCRQIEELVSVVIKFSHKYFTPAFVMEDTILT